MDTVCLRCHQKCSLKAEVKEGKVVRTSGGACIKGEVVPDVMYHPDRLRYPIKRTGRRGEGKWQRISWDEATSTIARELNEIKAKYGPNATTIQTGSGQKQIGAQTMAIAQMLFPTANCHGGRYTCIHPDAVASFGTIGDFATYENCPDYEHSKCIVFWGSNPDITIPLQVKDVRKALRNGAKLIVIDPRPIPMAKKADKWLKIRPGTDAALALAMVNVIINEELYDKEFVQKWCVGFDKLKKHVQNYTPDWAAGITWLSKEDIVEAARMYATTKPACIYVRCGVGAQHINSTQTSRAIHFLIYLCANLDVPGGNLMYNRTFTDALFYHTYLMRMDMRASIEVEAGRFGAKKYPLFWVCDMPETVQGMHDGRIQGLWCVTDNLVSAEMDSRRIWDAMKNKLKFIFVSEFFMTPTAELADIVLPAAFYQEIDNIVEAFDYPYNYITATKRVVEPLGECRDDREVAIEIAEKMGVDLEPYGWRSTKDLLNWRLKYLGITFDELWARSDHRFTFPREFRRYERGLYTPSGKVELYSSRFESVGLDPLPLFREPPESPVSTPELFKEFPLIYTHIRLLMYEHTEGRQIERQRKMMPDPLLEINPETASKLGIKEGDWVYLETPTSAKKGGHIQFKARFVPELHPNVVAGQHGWWFPEKPGPEHGCFDSNINALLTLDPPYDPAVGVPQTRAILCRVWKAGPQ